MKVSELIKLVKVGDEIEFKVCDEIEFKMKGKINNIYGTLNEDDRFGWIELKTDGESLFPIFKSYEIELISHVKKEEN